MASPGVGRIVHRERGVRSSKQNRAFAERDRAGKIPLGKRVLIRAARSWESPLRRRSLEYTFSPETFALHDIDTGKHSGPEASLVLYEWKKPPRALYTPRSDSFGIAMREQLDYFVACIAGGSPPRIGTGEQARRALEIALASKLSCETAKPTTCDSHQA